MNDVRAALESGSVADLVRATGTSFRNLEEAKQCFHLARTRAESVSLGKRQYSHKWLTDRGLPSMLPEDKRSTIVSVVGVIVDSNNPEVKIAIHDAMREAVLVAYADGESDPDKIRVLMLEARDREKRGLMLAANERAK